MTAPRKDTDQTLSLLVHALSKVGKSTLTSTAPLPLLVLDAEGSWRFIGRVGFDGTPLRKRRWDPMREAPPRHDGTWDVCVVTVQQWQTLTQIYQWLVQGQHDFVSIALDSITECQSRLKKNLVGTEAMKIQDWGSLLNQMDDFVRSMRDLVLLETVPVRCVIFIAETRERSGKWRPTMQGQISDQLPYRVDICGYYYVDKENDADGQPTIPVRKLLISPHPQYEAGERVQGVLGQVITRPNITDMMNKIFTTESIQQSMQEIK